MRELAAIVLCGGQSSRMGQAKAWLPFGAEPLLVRTTLTFARVVDLVVVVAAPLQDLPALPAGVRVARDEVSGLGPLAGLAAGLRAIAGEAEAAFVCATDAPFLDPSFVARVAELRGAHAIAAPEVRGKVHPLAAVYATDLLSVVDARLSARELRMTALLASADTRLLDAGTLLASPRLAADDPELRSLENLNTPAEYARALEELARGRPG